MRPRIKKIYDHMKSRCYLEKDAKYKNYGARGIKICDEWLNNFDSFYNWALKNGYQENLTIDRIDNNGNYEPNNCRWATPVQQANNRTTSRYYTYNGITKTIAEWSKETGIKVGTLYWRINQNYKPEEVMVKTKYKNRKRKYNHSYKGKILTIKEISKLINKTESTVHRYFKLGYSIDEIIEEKILKYGKIR